MAANCAVREQEMEGTADATLQRLPLGFQKVCSCPDIGLLVRVNR